MAALFLSDEAWADWMAETLAHLSQDQAKNIAVAALLPDDQAVTGYFNMSAADKAVIATHIQADAMLDVVKANGDTIQQAWEEKAEEQ